MPRSTLFDAVPWGTESSGLAAPAAVSRYQRAEGMEATEETDIDRANKVLSMAEVLLEWDREVPADSASWKFHCPLDFEHDDSKKMPSRSARYYGGSNAVMCFKMHGWITPVRLRAKTLRLSQMQTAKKVLREAGLGGATWYRQRWFDIQARMEQRAEEQPDPQYAVAALTVALSAVEGYSVRQYEPDVRAVLEGAVEELVAGMAVEDMRAWIDRSLERLKKVLA